MSYIDDQGKQHVVKGTAKAIRRSFKDGILEDPFKYKLAKSVEGPFEEMKVFPEFRDLAVHLTKPNSTPNSKTQSADPVPNPTSEPAKTIAELNRSKSSTPSWVYYVVGAGTHPGAGMPGVLASAKSLMSVLPPGAKGTTILIGLVG